MVVLDVINWKEEFLQIICTLNTVLSLGSRFSFSYTFVLFMFMDFLASITVASLVTGKYFSENSEVSPSLKLKKLYLSKRLYGHKLWDRGKVDE